MSSTQSWVDMESDDEECDSVEQSIMGNDDNDLTEDTLNDIDSVMLALVKRQTVSQLLEGAYNMYKKVNMSTSNTLSYDEIENDYNMSYPADKGDTRILTDQMRLLTYQMRLLTDQKRLLIDQIRLLTYQTRLLSD